MKKILQQLYAGTTFSEAETYAIMHRMGAGEFSETQVAAFLSALNMRSLSVDELKGFRRAMLDLCLSVDLDGLETIDLCGTGGDGKDTFNISTLSAFVVAGAGIPVTKHGNYAVSSHCGSSNVLESLGVKFTNDTNTIRRQLDKANITILHAPLFHPAMKHVAPARRGIQVKTVFNILGPLSNPCRPAVQVAGVYHLEIARLYYYLLQESGKKFAVVHALDGYDEISLTSDVKIFSHQGEKYYSPEQFGFEKLSAESLSGGDTIEDAKNIFLQVISGNGTIAQRNAVLANSGLCMATYKGVNLTEGVALAAESLDSGKAYQALKSLIELGE